MKEGFQNGVGLISLMGMISLWTRGDEISRSKFWFVGWFAYMFLLFVVARTLGPLIGMAMDQHGITDEQAVPALFITAIGFCVLIVAYQLYRLKTAHKRALAALKKLEKATCR